MSTTQRWTSADLDKLPDDGTRYEIIDGELFMSPPPHFYHQGVVMDLGAMLWNWNESLRLGRVVDGTGVTFDLDEVVIPDIMWISNERVATALRPNGQIDDAPELVIEVLSPGKTNERRDRVAKLTLYSRRGVDEYWIVNWQARNIEIYRRSGADLQLARTMLENEVLESSLLPGFTCPVSKIFFNIPIE
jgi:Uma2 family endonuclease